MPRAKPGSPNSPVTIVDVARVAGVSHSTVSRVLNDHPYIKEETRERVEAALESLGYVANLRARGLAGGKLGVVGLVVLDLESSYITEIVRAVDASLADAGIDLMLCTTHRREQRESSYVARLSLGLVDGLIVLLPRDVDRYARDLADRDFNFVLLDHAGSPLANSITADNESGARAAIAHLADLGHRRVGVITGDTSIDPGRQRLAATRAAISEFGLDGRDELIVEGDFLEDTAYRSTLALLELAEPPTAIFASSDTAAFGALRALADHDVAVPEQMSVVGFDDIPEAARTDPPLTTIRQPLAEMGRRAVQLLLERLDEPNRTVSHVRLPVELIERGSTARPPSR